jgi:AcrR family transcriptional regulator
MASKLSQQAPEQLTAKRIAKREKILSVAAELMNELGPGSLRLGLVAKEVGISRNSLYYYVKSSGELIGQSYRRTCAIVLKIITDAHCGESDAPDKIRQIVSELLNTKDRPLAVISDAAILPQSERAEIEARVDEFVGNLSEVLEAGVATGSFRPIDSNVVSHMILGMVFWAILWNRWISPNERAGGTDFQAAAQAICDVVLNGIAARSIPEFKATDQAESQFRATMRSSMAESEEVVPRKLMESASLLFNRHGIDSVSLDEIAATCGMTKGAIYHHFADKHALVLAAYERAFAIHNGIVDLTETATDSRVYQMLAIHYFNCRAQAEETPPLSIQPGVLLLPSSLLETAASLAGRMRQLHADAIKEGLLRPVDQSIAELTAGALIWIQNWRHTRTDLSAADIAEIMTAVVGQGILVAPDRDDCFIK